jgi:cytochrome c-type biogenesis protein CcmI
VIPALVVAALVVAALAFVLAPVMRGSRADADTGYSPAEEAEAKKRAAFSALVDLETDHEIGKLSATDFELLRSEYEREALAALKELDSLGAVQAVDDEPRSK